ncbi:MAG TPA: Hsp20/alpha crystallin family protein [Thermomicrobiales bacterium]|nr:Hsp20/alpha crystallin family protein [Thermomicrobiales bacterium]
MIVVRRGRSGLETKRPTDLEDLLRPAMTRAQMRGAQRGGWRPALEVFETTDSFEVVAELAGMNPDEIDIIIEGDVLSIRGSRPDPSTCLNRSYHEARIPYGAFSADALIPFPVDVDLAEATYQNGFLHVRIPRTQGRTIVARRIDRDHAQPAEGDA